MIFDTKIVRISLNHRNGTAFSAIYLVLVVKTVFRTAIFPKLDNRCGRRARAFPRVRSVLRETSCSHKLAADAARAPLHRVRVILRNINL